MNPGLSPIFINAVGINTNVPPAGNDPIHKPPVWELFYTVDMDPVPIASRNQGNLIV